MLSVVFFCLDDGVWTMAQCTEVCRTWWLESRHLVWRQIELRDLLFFVQDSFRRNQFASFVEELDFKPNDTILSTTEMTDAALSFPRLHSVNINESNLVNVRFDNLSTLMPPTLRSWIIEEDGELNRRGSDRDEKIHLDALLAGCDNLTTLDFPLFCKWSMLPTFLSILKRMSSIEDLNLGDVAEDLAEKFPQEFLLLLFNKSRLVDVDFPHAVEFPQVAVDTFLQILGCAWTIPSLESLSKPKFDSGTAAARLLARMPNLVQVWLSVYRWQNDLEQVFAVAGNLEKLENLDLDFRIRDCDLDGSWLLYLTTLKHLEGFSLEIRYPGTISLTGTQLANFLTGLPELEHLSLCVGPTQVSCSLEHKKTIDAAIANIEEANVADITLVTQDLS